jgi:hypothetical protein
MCAQPYAPLAVAVFGVSTQFGHYGFNLVCRIVEALAGRTLHLHIETLEELRDSFGRRGGGSVVLTSDLPNTDLVSFVCSSDIPIITFSESSRDVLDWVLSTRNPDPVESARFCSKMLSSLAAPFASDRALHIIGVQDLSLERIALMIVAYLFAGLDETSVARLLAYLAETGNFDSSAALDRSAYRNFETSNAAKPFDVEVYSEMVAAIASYEGIIAGKPPEEIVWPHHLFYRQDKRPLGEPFDLTGPARILYYGPYMHLPIGNWSVRFEFEIDGAISGIEATTDIYINEVVIEKTFAMPAKGIYAYSLSFEVYDPLVAVQIRLFTKKAAIEGVFLPRSVRVRPR